MIEVNGREYKINLDIKLGTQKLMKAIMDDPQNENSQSYLELILQDLLIPMPSKSELFHFRRSDVEKIMEQFSKESNELAEDYKKKRST